MMITTVTVTADDFFNLVHDIGWCAESEPAIGTGERDMKRHRNTRAKAVRFLQGCIYTQTHAHT